MAVFNETIPNNPSYDITQKQVQQQLKKKMILDMQLFLLLQMNKYSTNILLEVY